MMSNDIKKAKKALKTEVDALQAEEASRIQYMLSHFDIHSQAGRTSIDQQKTFCIAISELSAQAASQLFRPANEVYIPVHESAPIVVRELMAILETYDVLSFPGIAVVYDEHNKVKELGAVVIPYNQFKPFTKLLTNSLTKGNLND